MPKYTIDTLRIAVEQSTSIRQVLSKLSLKEAGGNYATINRKLQEYKIDHSHFTGQGHLKGKNHTWAIKKPIDEILTQESWFRSSHLKKRLVQEGYLTDECSRCRLTDWLGEKISLHLDHINGERTDNRIENLRLLCPNCHSLTDTYCGKNKRKA